MGHFRIRKRTLEVTGLLLLLSGCNELKEISMDVSVLQKEGVQKNPVGILHNGHNYCGATLLENGNVLTAGHCVSNTMAVRFQNPDGNFKIVTIKRVLKKDTGKFDAVLNPPILQNIARSRDFALLEVENPKPLQDEFSFFKLVEEHELKNAYDATAPVGHYADGNFWLYDIFGNKHTIRKQRGDLSLVEAYQARFFEVFKSLVVVQTKLVAQQSGSPFIFNNKIYGVATYRMAASQSEALSGDLTAGIITHALAIQ